MTFTCLLQLVHSVEDNVLILIFDLDPGSICFGVTICKTVRPMLSDCCLYCLSVCPVCNVGVLWPNGWIEQDEIWH